MCGCNLIIGKCSNVLQKDMKWPLFSSALQLAVFPYRWTHDDESLNGAALLEYSVVNNPSK